MQAHVLVDYHNLPRSVRNSGTVSIARTLDELVQAHVPKTDEVHIRLYGGWYDEAGLSNDGSRLTQEIGRNFPIALSERRGQIRYIFCEIASSLIESRSDLLPATVRRAHGLGWFEKQAHPSGCVDLPGCTISTVMNWSRRGCPSTNCPVTHFEAFTAKQQKLVDTLLCCDLLSVAGAESRTLVVSEDDDLIPALLLAGSRGARIWHVRSKGDKVRLYDGMLLRRGVQLISL